MPQRLYSSSDVPDYGTYPESPRSVTVAEGILVSSNAPFVDDAGNAAQTGKVADLKQKASDVLDSAKARAASLKDSAVESGSRYVDMAKDNARDLTRKTREFSRTATRDYPIHVIAAAAVVGLLLGIGLRAWRENRV
jgi:ElaB/YqjD/DUF883 family membrane-anchored ribosome-binding protein